MDTSDVVCAVCDRPERTCDCDRYCCICSGLYGIRLCVDGLFYCPDCREACQVSAVKRDDEQLD